MSYYSTFVGTYVHIYIRTWNACILMCGGSVLMYLCNSCILPWCATAAIKC